MLRPAAIAAVNYEAAFNRPEQGYERRLYVSLQQTYELGSFAIAAVNSGTFTANAAQAAALLADPRELLFVLNSDVDSANSATIALAVTGLDELGGALTGTATIAVPAWSSETRGNFPRGWAAEVIPAVADKKFSKINAVTVTAHADYANAELLCLAVPPLSSFSLIACRSEMTFTRKVQRPFPIQCGIDEGAFIKKGNIAVGNLSVSGKLFNGATGLARINGHRVTGMFKVLKEDVYDTQHTFLKGLVLSGDESSPEGADPTTFSAQGMFEVSATLLAQ